MTLALVNVGTVADDQTGDNGQVPFQKVNAAITQVNTNVIAIANQSSNITAALTNSSAALTASGTNATAITALQAEVAGLVSGGTPAFGASILSPTQLATTTNDYSPTSWATSVSALRLTPASGGSTLNGIAALTFAAETTFKVTNISTTDSLTFAHANSGSAAANRFSCPNNAGFTLGPNAQTIVTRDGTSSVWRFV